MRLARIPLGLRLTAALLIAWGAASAMIACTRAAPVHTVAVAKIAGPRMDHVGHMDRGLECANCHIENAVPGDPKEPRAPTYAACKECHDDEDAKKPEAEKIKNVFFRPDGKPSWQPAIVRYDPEIHFRHANHEKTACAVCHGEMKGKQRVEGLMFSMDTCMACHANKGVANRCESCHTQIRDNVRPATHDHLWRQRHGQIARSPAQLVEGRCTLCHDKPTFCEGCHRDEKPANHTNLWRIRTHGVMAAIDRRSCQVCHTTDYCVRCHEETSPISHRAAWATGPQIHCMECHFPITRRDQSCAVCHKDNPTHDTAPDMPPTHTPAMNCRLCHNPPGVGGAPPIPHPDNGTQCTICHH